MIRDSLYKGFPFTRDFSQNKTCKTRQSRINGQKHQTLIADFNDPNQLKIIIKNHINQGNKYDILINNSGGPKGGPIEKADISEFLEAFL